ncbi:MAG: CRISPR-associated endoribonuclease Cas6 [Saprospiraceae bacterium]|nr:CRISPR-associated endoribonuclease Cas6 [Saprospiraceae bacterium]
MRIYLKLSKNKEIVPFDHQINLVGAFHKWIGRNTIHDQVSMYSLSWLRGGKGLGKTGLIFPEGADWFISTYDVELVKKTLNGILDNPQVAFGMNVVEVTLRETPGYESGSRFYLGSPVLIKRNLGEKQKHFTFEEVETDTLLTETFHFKLSKAGLPVTGAFVRFDREHPAAKTKLSTYRNIQNKVNYCPVIIEGSPEQIGFAWDVGVGNSTGIGFGSLQ